MEKLMQYVWQHRLFPAAGLKTVDGRRVSIINPGLLNKASGPDFFNASIEIEGQKWVGNVEIHVRASDWHRHGHHNDPAYDSVILHVVDYDDTAISRRDGQIIPQMRLPCSPDLNMSFHRLVDTAPAELPCCREIAAMPSIYLTDWLTALGFERLQMKADRIGATLASYRGDWEETAYITLARALGFGLNGDPFERLARSLPLRFLRKHSDDPIVAEALFFGQSGLLQKAQYDPYVDRLIHDYSYYATKFGLKAPDSLGWKIAGTRPQNFPYRRIAMLASMVTRSRTLLSSILEVNGIEEARTLFSPASTYYWEHHYTLGGNPAETPIGLSKTFLDLLLINCLIPLGYAYCNSTGEFSKADRFANLLEDIKPEKNRIVSLFADAGIRIRDAFTSQAVIQLRRQYCEQRKCLYCRIGHRHLASKALRQPVTK